MKSATPTWQAILTFLILLVLLLHQWSHSPNEPKLDSFAKLSWAKLQGVVLGDAPEGLTGAEQSVGDLRLIPDHQPTAALSEPFTLKTQFLAFEYVCGSRLATDSSGLSQILLRLVSDSSRIVKEVPLLNCEQVTKPATWRRLIIEIPTEFVDKDVSLRLLARRPSQTSLWFSLRNKVSFLSESSLLPQAPYWLIQPETRQLMLIALAVLISALAAFILRAPLSLPAHALLLLSLAIGVQFRWEVFFYFDEWHVLERFMKLGASGVIYTHNEHFLPLFFGWYYLESLLFGDSYRLYLLLSFVLHAINGLLLALLLKRLAGGALLANAVAQIIAILYVISGLHGEALQWSFEQSLLLAQTASMSALIVAWDYIRFGGRWRLAVVAVCAIVAPLLFGNGFTLVANLALLAGLQVLIYRTDGRSLAEFRKAAIVCVVAILAIAVPALFYIQFRQGVGHGIAKAKPFGNLAATAEYLFVGTQLGTVLRGSGAYFSLELTPAAPFLSVLLQSLPKSLATWLQNLASHVGPEMVFAYFGMAISSLLALVSLRAKTSSKTMLLWLTGQAFMLTALILPSLGRWQHGSIQSLALRYHYTGLVGFAILVLPFFLVCLEPLALASEQTPKRRKANWLTVMLALLLVFATTYRQLSLGQEYSYFTSYGEAHRKYVTELLVWNKSLRELATSHKLDYEATGTKFAQLQPAHLASITPARHPDQIYAVLNWLNPKGYPQREK